MDSQNCKCICFASVKDITSFISVSLVSISSPLSWSSNDDSKTPYSIRCRGDLFRIVPIVLSHSQLLLFQVASIENITYLTLKICLSTTSTLLVPTRNSRIYAYLLLNSSIINALSDPSCQLNPWGPYSYASSLSC